MAASKPDQGVRQPPPGRYAQGKRSPIVWVLLCDVCAGFALNVDESYRGYLSGRCQGCGSEAPELHRFTAYIATSEGCDDHSGSCAGRHPRVFGDLSALGGDDLDRLRAGNEDLRKRYAAVRRAYGLEAQERGRLAAENEHQRERIASLMLDEPSKSAGLYAAIDELQAERTPRCQHCPAPTPAADERSFMCEDCAGKADEEAQNLRDEVERLRAGLVEIRDACEPEDPIFITAAGVLVVDPAALEWTPERSAYWAQFQGSAPSVSVASDEQRPALEGHCECGWKLIGPHDGDQWCTRCTPPGSHPTPKEDR